MGEGEIMNGSLTYIDQFDVIPLHGSQCQGDILQVLMLIEGLPYHPPDPLLLEHLHQGAQPDPVAKIRLQVLDAVFLGLKLLVRPVHERVQLDSNPPVICASHAVGRVSGRRPGIIHSNQIIIIRHAGGTVVVGLYSIVALLNFYPNVSPCCLLRLLPTPYSTILARYDLQRFTLNESTVVSR